MSSSASFIEPMLCLAVSKLPEGPEWEYELKLDGYRAIGVRADFGSRLFSRNGKNFNGRFPTIAKALEQLPRNTVIDGEVVALGSDGKPSFSALQNFDDAPLLFYAFDIPLVVGEDLTKQALKERRRLLEKVLSRLRGPIRMSETFDVTAAEMIAAVRGQGLEGIVAKRLSSRYQPGQRSGDWVKLRVNQLQDFVIGGYIPAGSNFDSIIVGYYQGRRLMYAARVRAGFVPATRRAVFERFEGLAIRLCPFANLPEATKGRWGEGLTAEDMKNCRWLKPRLVAAIEFLEWTSANRLRHCKFGALRDDRNPQHVRREPER
jgi:DNA ligase D-like protein (predicted ligase)